MAYPALDGRGEGLRSRYVHGGASYVASSAEMRIIMMGEDIYEQFKEVIANFASCMDDYLYVYDMKQDRYYISERALQRFQVPENEFRQVNEMHKIFVHEEDFPMLSEDLDKMARGEKEYHNLQYRWLGKKGEPIWINCRGKIIRDEKDRSAFMIGCINEIGKRQKADNISGLLGEAAFQKQLEEFQGNCPDGFLLRIGIDDFRDINEKFGSDYGDFVLRTIAACIEECIGPEQKAYRMSGDEFVVFDFHGGSSEEADELYRCIRTAVDRMIEEHHYEAVYTISSGIVPNRHIYHLGYLGLTKISQFALSQAKCQGKNQSYIFQGEDYTSFLRKRRILRALRESVENDFAGFDLFFQPIVHAGSEKLYAAESLLRFWLSPEEIVSPVEFIPILEESGLIIPVGKWILRTAFSMCQACQKQYPDFKISVNLSYIQILKSPIFEEIMSGIGDEVLQPSSVIVELTESGYLENSPSIQSMWDKLKEKGVNIALDDFGTGYSNLQSIGSTMPHIVKIDRSFTVKALNNDYENRLMRHVIQMVHSIGLQTCVEGVETEDELAKVVEMGADFIQGYYYSKPCSRQEFLGKFLAQ